MEILGLIDRAFDGDWSRKLSLEIDYLKHWILILSEMKTVLPFHALERFISSFPYCPLWPVVPDRLFHAFPKPLRFLVLLSRMVPCLHCLPLCYMLFTLSAFSGMYVKELSKWQSSRCVQGIITITVMGLSLPVSLAIDIWEARTPPHPWSMEIKFEGLGK